ncbi:hypothetical protein LOTGIDRAFT_137913 [Lottia gigantea]|uniref:Vta1/callose synthase N-terminal domain-containing protein n=1 Tax=Lottia gigantea TaxID=225164 RepID=V4CLF8_LOTGI|nr:hypothetical protein LOTGIDRAFT_137913 [Lottia gigantea]ESP03130.1 hypothetical protein LOTGIDRAFT_137913 [Lottia gigantea]
MASSTLPPLPAKLKPIQHYLKTAIEHEQRDAVIAYYCQLYAMQKGMAIDRKSPDCLKFLMSLMELLEKKKTEFSDNEAIHNEVVGQAHVENYALKVFLYADNEDRAGRFNKNVVKSFYTAGMLFDVLSNFGELSDMVEKNRKYAKWKAAYIHKCLKNGETPVPGPLPEDGDCNLLLDNKHSVICITDEEVGQPPAHIAQDGMMPPPSGGGSMPPPSGGGSMPQPGGSGGLNLPGPMDGSMYNPATGSYAPPTTPQDTPRAVTPVNPPPQQPVNTSWAPQPNPAGVNLSTSEYQRAMKLCKFASSALQYEDSKTAIDNLSKALKLLTTGSES